MNHRANFYAVSFILAGEIRNHTNTQKVTNKQTKQANKQNNSKRYIHILPISKYV